jgi:hypothetical protein
MHVHSPSENRVLHPVFAKTPSKNAGCPAPKKTEKRSPFGAGFGCSRKGGEAQGVVVLLEFEAEGFDDEAVVVALRQAGDGD